MQECNLDFSKPMSMWSDGGRFGSRSSAAAKLKTQADFYDTLYWPLAIDIGAFHEETLLSAVDNQNLTCISDLERDLLKVPRSSFE